MATPDDAATIPGGAPDVLSSPTPFWSGRWSAVLAAVIGTAGVGIASTGVAVAVAFAGGGPQPEDVLPADVVALVKVDLDPAAGQKTAALELAERLPDLGVDGEGDLRDDLLRQLFEGEELDYDAQVRPWIGDRLAVAAVPGSAEVEPVLVVQHDDRDAAERLLPEVLAAAGEPAAFAFSERAPYVVVAQTQEVADRVASAEEVLADDERYTADVDALDGDQIALAWGDVGRVWEGLPAQERELASAGFPGGFSPSGRAVVGLHLEDDAVELTGRYVDLDLGDDALNTYTLGAGSGTGLLTELPAGAVGALSLAGLGEQVEALIELATGGLGAPEGEALSEDDLAELERMLGISIPEDVQALLGDELAIGLYDQDGEPQVAARTRGGDPARGLDVAQQLLDFTVSVGDPQVAQQSCFDFYDEAVERGDLYATDVSREDFCADVIAEEPAPGPLSEGGVAPVEDGVALSSSQELLDRMAAGGLGDDELFQRAVPDVDGASSVGFVDLQRALTLFEQNEEDLAALEAVGFTSTGGSDGGFVVRLTVR